MVFSYIVRWSALTSILSGVLFMVLTTLPRDAQRGVTGSQSV
jgi:hypothetical protein